MNLRDTLPRNAAEANRLLRDLRDEKQNQGTYLPRVRNAARLAIAKMLAQFGGLPFEHAARLDYPDAVRRAAGDWDALQRTGQGGSHCRIQS